MMLLRVSYASVALLLYVDIYCYVTAYV